MVVVLQRLSTEAGRGFWGVEALPEPVLEPVVGMGIDSVPRISVRPISSISSTPTEQGGGQLFPQAIAQDVTHNCDVVALISDFRYGIRWTWP